jgi:hypothetical protein
VRLREFGRRLNGGRIKTHGCTLLFVSASLRREMVLM